MATKVKDGLFIGDLDTAQDPEFIELNKIRYILNCSGRQIPNFWGNHGVKYLSLNWDDNEDCIIFDQEGIVVQQIVQFIERALKTGECILIHSMLGTSRCTVATVTYLMVKYWWGLEKAYEFLRMKRNDIHPNRGFMQQLYLLDKKLRCQRKKTNPEYLKARVESWSPEAIIQTKNNIVSNNNNNSNNSNNKKKNNNHINVNVNNGNGILHNSNNHAAIFNGIQEGDDELVLINSFLNGQSNLTYIPPPNPNVEYRPPLALKWIDDPRLGYMSNHGGRILQQSQPIRPKNASYNSLHATSTIIDYNSIDKKTKLKSILREKLLPSNHSHSHIGDKNHNNHNNNTAATATAISYLADAKNNSSSSASSASSSGSGRENASESKQNYYGAKLVSEDKLSSSSSSNSNNTSLTGDHHNSEHNNTSNNHNHNNTLLRTKELEEDADTYSFALLRKSKQPKDGWETAENRLNQILQEVEERGHFPPPQQEQQEQYNNLSRNSDNKYNNSSNNRNNNNNDYKYFVSSADQYGISDPATGAGRMDSTSSSSSYEKTGGSSYYNKDRETKKQQYDNISENINWANQRNSSSSNYRSRNSYNNESDLMYNDDIEESKKEHLNNSSSNKKYIHSNYLKGRNDRSETSSSQQRPSSSQSQSQSQSQSSWCSTSNMNKTSTSTLADDIQTNGISIRKLYSQSNVNNNSNNSKNKSNNNTFSVPKSNSSSSSSSKGAGMGTFQPIRAVHNKFGSGNNSRGEDDFRQWARPSSADSARSNSYYDHTASSRQYASSSNRGGATNQRPSSANSFQQGDYLSSSSQRTYRHGSPAPVRRSKSSNNAANSSSGPSVGIKGSSSRLHGSNTKYSKSAPSTSDTSAGGYSGNQSSFTAGTPTRSHSPFRSGTPTRESSRYQSATAASFGSQEIRDKYTKSRRSPSPMRSPGIHTGSSTRRGTRKWK